MAPAYWAAGRGRAGRKPPEREKRVITEVCEAFIRDVLKPRFLAENHPTEFNYPVDIFGKWHGGGYRFIQRWRSGSPEDAAQPEFDAAFARITNMGPDRFDLAYFRHAEQWWTLYADASLAEALSILETEGVFHPIT